MGESPPMPAPLRGGVIGAGVFGGYHARQYARLPGAVLSAVLDPHPDRAASVAMPLGGRAFHDLTEFLEAVDVVTVASPATFHAEHALAALAAGKSVYIEKPIATSVADGETVRAAAAAKGLVVACGHQERVVFQAMGLLDIPEQPLLLEALRHGPPSERSRDVSAILDLMIHDLDLVLALVDSEIESVDAIGGAVASQHEDIANARLRFRNGAVASITASRISPRIERRMRIFAQDRYLAADFAARKLTVIHRSGSDDAQDAMPVPGVTGFAMEDVSWAHHDSLSAEHAAFAASVLDGAPVLVDAAVGRRALAAALEVARSMRESRERMTASGLIMPPRGQAAAVE